MNLTIEILGTEVSVYGGIDGHYCGTTVRGYKKFSSLEEFSAQYPELPCNVLRFHCDKFLNIKSSKYIRYTLNGKEYHCGFPCPEAIWDGLYDKYVRPLEGFDEKMKALDEISARTYTLKELVELL